MGFNNENGRRLVFDLETAPLSEAADYLEPPDAPANYKDPAKIKAYIEEKSAEQVGRCSLDPDLCRIVAISTWAEEDYSGPMVFHAGESAEADMLAFFWNEAKGKHLVGFNVLAFDLPVLLRRSLYLGITAPQIQIDKYRHPEVTDLQMVLSFNGALRMRGLSFYAKRFGFEVEDGITGADIAQAVEEERWDDIAHHAKADVRKTALLAARCGYFSQLTAQAS